ncbi:MAG: DUF3300 domain-containing protein [Proteobacteria bacterium]|nr:DUF3300 domain-containing protein [Pseudomonadota bacterium]
MTAKTCVRILIWVLVLLTAAPPGVFAQSSGVPPVFRQEQLDQILAPIALYPDSLLVQVLMAATYPIEVVEANRWATANRSLSAGRFAAALDQQNWDPSIKSLVNFPSVLGMMDQRLDWTQRLGDAFLSQEDQVMATVQKLRAVAQAQNTLLNTNQQRVITQGQIIVIEPVNPQVVYVPAYDPMIVYGPWWHPAYPPYRCYPVGTVITGSIISFGLAVVIGAAWGYAWGGFDWGHHRATINVYQNTYVNNRYINRNVYASRYSGGHGAWQHDPVHRKGAIYRDQNVAQQFGQVPKGNPDERRDFRGHTPDTTGMSQTRNRGDVQGHRDVSGTNRPPAQRDINATARQVPQQQRVQAHQQQARVPQQQRAQVPQQQRVQASQQQVQVPQQQRAQTPQQQKVPTVLNGVGNSGREVKTQSDRGLASRQTVITPKVGLATQSANVSRPGGTQGTQPSNVNVGRPGSEKGNQPGGANAGRPDGSHP